MAHLEAKRLCSLAGNCLQDWNELDLPGFLSRITKLIREPEILASATALHIEQGPEEIQQFDVPVQIMAPEHDPQFTQELKALKNEVLPMLGVPYDYQYFPSLTHGSPTRGNLNDREEMLGAERAKDAAVFRFRHWLHKQRKTKLIKVE
ncbi:hypothetical protein AnigIFM63309_002229 [Aspergillus niger]|nr:hypothetical protein AnigIFM63309_002229 [Aspergillus niger]